MPTDEELNRIRQLPRRKLKIVSDGTRHRTFITTVDEAGVEQAVVDLVTKIDIEMGAEDEIVKAHLEILLPQVDVIAEEGCRVVRQG